MSIKLLHQNTFNIKEITVHKLLEIKGNLIGDLSITSNPIMLFIDQLPVIKFTEEEILLSLKNNKEYKKLFDDLDNFIISYIHDHDIPNKYNLKKFNYTPFINSYTNLQGETFDVLKLKLNLLGPEEFRTILFYRYGQPIENLDVMKGDVLVKTVLECLNITFDNNNKNIYIDNCVRQLKVKCLHPKRLDNNNLPYSFIDSDDDKASVSQEETQEEISENDAQESSDTQEELDAQEELSKSDTQEESVHSDNLYENDSDIAKLFMDDKPAIREIDNNSNHNSQSNTSDDNLDD